MALELLMAADYLDAWWVWHVKSHDCHIIWIYHCWKIAWLLCPFPDDSTAISRRFVRVWRHQCCKPCSWFTCKSQDTCRSLCIILITVVFPRYGTAVYTSFPPHPVLCNWIDTSHAADVQTELPNSTYCFIKIQACAAVELSPPRSWKIYQQPHPVVLPGWNWNNAGVTMRKKALIPQQWPSYTTSTGVVEPTSFEDKNHSFIHASR